jgi:hypothetical protein
MPPRKAAPASAPPSPPHAPITAPNPSAISKRKLPGFIRQGAAKLAKKSVSFDEPVMSEISVVQPLEVDSVTAPWEELVTIPWVEVLDSSLKEGQVSQEVDSKLVTAPWVEVVDSNLEEVEMSSEDACLVLENMYDVFQKLSEECQDRVLETKEKRAMNGGPTPPSSQDSVDSANSANSNQFDLALSSATDFAESSEIFDFIFEYISDHQKDIYGRISTGEITRVAAEAFLRNAPRDLLAILETALMEAERKVNHFSA